MIEVETLMQNMESMTDLLYQANQGVYKLLPALMQGIQEFMEQFIAEIPAFEQMGLEIPVGIIVEQIKRLNYAVETGDTMLMADVLKYEIADTIETYQQIKPYAGEQH